MPLDPVLKRYLSHLYAKGFGEIHRYTIEKLRPTLTYPPLKPHNALYTDLFTSGGLMLRAFSPTTDPTACLPGVLFVCGTAFLVDRQDASINYCSFLANKLRMRLFNMVPRLAPEHKLDQMVHDCVQNVEWLCQQAHSLGIDPEKIAIWGESSGGSIAASATHLLRDQDKNILKHQTLFYPKTDYATLYPSQTEYAFGYMLDRTFTEKIMANIFSVEHNPADPIFSPINSTNFKQLPPATLITAECDPLRDEGESYVKKLQDAGIPVTFKRYAGMIHGFAQFHEKIDHAKQAVHFATTALQDFFHP